MSSKPPLVPSKNALRALRRLALQGSTIIGAVGSLCGAAALSYDAHQRVKFAQRILETKRTIRSVSNGEGAAHVQRMFEAAERGEDFGLDPAKAHLRRRRRNFSALTARESMQELEDTARLVGTGVRAGTESPLDVGQVSDELRSAENGPPTEIPSIESARQDDEFWRRLEARKKSGGLAAHRAAHASDHQVRQYINERLQRPRPRYPLSRHSGLQKHETQWYSLDLNENPVPPKGINKADLPPSRESNTRFESTSPAPARKTAAVGKIIAASQQQHKSGSNTVYGRPGTRPRSDKLGEAEAPKLEPKHSPSPSQAERIIAATQQQHKLSSHTVYGRPRATASNLKAGLAENVSLWLKQNRNEPSPVQKRQMSSNAQTSRPRIPGTPTPSKSSYLRGLRSTPPNAESEMAIQQPRVGPSSTMPPYKFAPFNQKHDFKGTDSRHEVRTLQLLDGKFRDWPTSIAEVDQEGDTSVNNRAWIPVELPPVFKKPVDSKTLPVEVAMDPLMNGSIKLIPAPIESVKIRHRPEQVVNSKLDELLATGREPEARNIWVRTMTTYSTKGENYDIKRLDHMHMAYHGYFRRSSSPFPIRHLARHLLENDIQFDRAARLLFPLRPENRKYLAFPGTYPRAVVITSSQYLHDLWAEEQDVEMILLHFQKVLAAARHCRVEVNENLFRPVIGMLCSVGEMETAQAVYNEMISRHHVESTFYTRSPLVRGYACAGNWDRVEEEMDDMYFSDLAHKTAHGYALMFDAVLKERLLQKSLIEAYDYLVHAIGYWGVVPTNHVSGTIIQACLEHHRYDMIREWVETVRTLFPQVIISKGIDFEFRMGETWRHMQASCVDINAACTAIAYRSLGQPFGKGFKEIVRDSLAADLAKRLDRLESPYYNLHSRGAQDSNDLTDLDVYLARSFAVLSKSDIGHSAKERGVRELRRQVEAVESLNRLLMTEDVSDVLPSKTIADDESSVQRKHSHSAFGSQDSSIYAAFPQAFLEPLPPSYASMNSLLFGYYASRVKQGLAVTHEVLEHLCEKLQRRQREAHLVMLLDEVSRNLHGYLMALPPPVDRKHPPVETAPFSISLYMVWLQATRQLKSGFYLRKVLWSLLDEPANIRLTRSFVALAETSVLKMSHNRFHEASDEEQKELKWLLNRLKHRYWDQRGMGGDAPWREKKKWISNEADEEMEWGEEWEWDDGDGDDGGDGGDDEGLAVEEAER